MPLADTWEIFDNSGIEHNLVVKFNKKGLQVIDKSLYRRLIKSGDKA